MLRITVHEDNAKWVMKLEGTLAAEWVAETEAAWHLAPKDKVLEIDLRSLVGADEAGKQLLGLMHRAGATFSTASLWSRELILDIRRHVAVLGLLLILSLLSPVAIKAQDAPVRLTLKDAVNIALKQNPQVVIANLNLIESKEQVKIARSALLPQVGFETSDKITRGSVPAIFGFQIPGIPEHIGPYWVFQSGAAISAPIFDLTLWRRWQAARAMTSASAAQETTTRELYAQLVVSQYLGAMRAAADVDAAKSRLDLANALAKLASDMQAAGAGTGIDTLRAQVQVQNEKQRFAEANTQLKIALYGLGRLLNLKPEQPIELADAPSFFETPAYDADGTLASTYQARPEMQAIAARIRAAEQQKSAARSIRIPRLSVNGGWAQQGLTPSTVIPVYQFGAQIDMPLFTGGRIAAETATADLEIRKLNQAQLDLRNQIALEVKSALAQLESARTEVEAANLGVGLAKEGVRQAQDRFRAGVANNVEVITAQDELARANDNQIRALYAYNQSRADLARATGQMEAMYAK
jgi:outer membrane protein TolC